VLLHVCAIFRPQNTPEIPSRSDQNYEEKPYFGPWYLNYRSV